MGIEQYLQQILSARYGKDVRQSIHDSIYEINEVAKKAEYDASTAPESAKAYAQAALASEQAAEDYKTAAEQAAQQAMSGTPEGYADLVAKVNSIYRQTATSYNVIGTSEGSALAHTIYGMSIQDGTPTPSVPVEIQSAKADFRCVGKNLIPYPYYETTKTITGITFTDNGNGTIVIDGTSSAQSFFTLAQRTKQPLVLYPGTYTLSVESSLTDNGLWLQLIDSSNTEITHLYGDTISRNFVISQKTNCGLLFVLANNKTITNLTVKPMITLSDADQTWEEYKSKSVTTDLNLRAIEVQSTDNYNLVKEGKYYIADTIDWSEDRGYEITRRINTFTLNGSESGWSMAADDYRFSIRYDTAMGYPKSILDPLAMMSHFTFSSSNNSPWGKSYMSTFGWLVICNNDQVITTLDAFKTWLAENTPEYQYILATPITESITSAQAQALLSLKTYDEATSISATGDIEPSLDLEYSKDRNTALALTGHNIAHKNALKLNDINTALIELGGN